MTGDKRIPKNNAKKALKGIQIYGKYVFKKWKIVLRAFMIDCLSILRNLTTYSRNLLNSLRNSSNKNIKG
jgi:hypothetical protein